MSAIFNATQSLMTEAYGYYVWTLSLADSRTKGWLLVDSPMPTIVYTALYLLIVGLGPRIMRDRKPFKLTWALVPYNLAMAVLNFYIAYELFMASTELKYSYVCQPITRLQHPQELRVVNAVWWYYFSKLLEFCDTFFFILRKKDSQLTFLHVYHHATMFSLWWIGIKWVPSGSTFLPAMANSFIHVLMYSYYGLSALGPKIAKYLWWKKYLTILQLFAHVIAHMSCQKDWWRLCWKSMFAHGMECYRKIRNLIQFTTAMVLGINGIKNGCDFPLWMQYTLVIYMISFLVLFGNFYAKAYIKKGRDAYYGKTNGVSHFKKGA